MNASNLDLNALSHALDDSSPDREHFFDLQSASLWTFVFSDATDEAREAYETARQATDRWRPVPSRSPQETFEEIEDFVEALPEGATQEALFVALERRGAFRNFREALMEHQDIRQQWLAASKRRSRQRLAGFLESVGLALPEVEAVGAAS